MCPLDPPASYLEALPSWCPDLSLTRGISGMMQIDPPFNASKRQHWDDHGNRIHATHAITIEDRRLNVKTIPLARIKTSGMLPMDTFGEAMEPWIHQLLSQSLVYSFTGQNRVEAFWRTLIMNANANKSPAQWPQFEAGGPFRALVLGGIWLQYQEAKKRGIDLG